MWLADDQRAARRPGCARRPSNRVRPTSQPDRVEEDRAERDPEPALLPRHPVVLLLAVRRSSARSLPVTGCHRSTRPRRRQVGRCRSGQGLPAVGSRRSGQAAAGGQDPAARRRRRRCRRAAAHTRLALALAHDTVAAARAADRVRTCSSSSPIRRSRRSWRAVGVEVVPDARARPQRRARAAARSCCASGDPGAVVGALQADLPALRPAELDAALGAAAALFDARRAPCVLRRRAGRRDDAAARRPGRRARSALRRRVGRRAHRASGAVAAGRRLAGPAPRRRHLRRPRRGRRARPRPHTACWPAGAASAPASTTPTTRLPER